MVKGKKWKGLDRASDEYLKFLECEKLRIESLRIRKQINDENLKRKGSLKYLSP
jgi:hypothetical protein